MQGNKVDAGESRQAHEEYNRSVLGSHTALGGILRNADKRVPDAQSGTKI